MEKKRNPEKCKRKNQNLEKDKTEIGEKIKRIS